MAISWLSRKRVAFTLIELLVVISIIVLLVSLALPVLSSARRSSRTLICTTNMSSIGRLANSYATDSRDALFGFSWNPASRPSIASEDPQVRWLIDNAIDSTQAHVAQAVSLIRTYGDDPQFDYSTATGWQPNALFGHLPLAQYADLPAPARIFVCPNDTTFLNWQDRGRFVSDLPALASVTGGNVAFTRRYRLASSYVRTAGAWHPDIGPLAIVPMDNSSFNSVFSASLRLGNRKLTDVAFPSQKVWLFDKQDRHSARYQMFYANTEAAQPLLMFDGSVDFRKYRDANRSGNPSRWNIVGPTGVPPRVQISYDPNPALGEAPEVRFVSGGGYDVKFWYTHGGLRGIDYGGRNVDTRFWLP
jgi:type II secretory pathway pseudopilin PulG